jgi:hypothetical protein
MEEINKLEDERYKMERKSETVWFVTDKLYLICAEFEEHKFNETQKFTTLNDLNEDIFPALPRIAREMAEWLRENHYNKVF